MTEPEIRPPVAEFRHAVAEPEMSLMALLAADPANALEELAPGVYLARIDEGNRWSVSGS